MILSKLDRRRKGVFGPMMGKKCIVFVDDLNMPVKETYGAQPPIECLRQLVDHGFWYEKKDTTRMDLVDVLLVTAMGPPGGGRNQITPRFLRHFNLIGIESFDDATMARIFGTIIDWHFNKGFDGSVKRLSPMLVQATAEMYQQSVKQLLPTPAKSHYLFNLRDFSRVVQGLLLCPSTVLDTGDKCIRLWTHEAFRVFSDRLVDEDDQRTVFNMVKK